MSTSLVIKEFLCQNISRRDVCVIGSRKSTNPVVVSNNSDGNQIRCSVFKVVKKCDSGDVSVYKSVMTWERLQFVLYLNVCMVHVMIFFQY